MIDIIVIFPKQNDGQAIKSLLTRNGYRVASVFTSGAQAKSLMDTLDYGIVVCGYQFADMLYSELYQDMGETFQMLLLASRTKLDFVYEDGIVCVEMPLKAYDFLETLSMMTVALERLKKKGREKGRERNVAQKAIIEEAKKLLMENRHMTEEEAHRYIQKNSMDSGTSMVETAQMVLEIIH